MDSLIIVAQKPREFLTDAASPHVDFISGSHKMVLKGAGGGEERRGRAQGEKNEVMERIGEREGRERCRLASRWLPRLLVYSLVQP